MKYAEARLEIREGDVLLFESRSTFARVIRWATRSRFSHAAIAAWWGERLMAVESLEGKGCRAIPLSDVVAASKSIAVYRVRNGGWSQARQAAQEAVGRLGSSYGWGAIARDALARLPLLALLWHSRHYSLDDLEDPGVRLKCSTLVAWAWRKAGVDLVPNLADRSTDPGDLARSAALVPVLVLEPG